LVSTNGVMSVSPGSGSKTDGRTTRLMVPASQPLELHHPAGPPGSSLVLTPQRWPLLEMVSALAPSVVDGNTAVVVTSEGAPIAGRARRRHRPERPPLAAVPQSDDWPPTIRLIAD
jgi:hypothetical protein